MNTNIMLLALGLAMDAEDGGDLPEGAPGVADRLQDDGGGAGGGQPGEGQLLETAVEEWWDGGTTDQREGRGVGGAGRQEPEGAS